MVLMVDFCGFSYDVCVDYELSRDSRFSDLWRVSAKIFITTQRQDWYLWFSGFVQRLCAVERALILALISLWFDSLWWFFFITGRLFLCWDMQIRGLMVRFGVMIWRMGLAVEYKYEPRVRQQHHLNCVLLSFFDLLQFVFFFFETSVVLFVTMSQSLMLGQSSSAKGVIPSVVKHKVKVPFFDKALIEGYAKTVVGRCLNPRAQDMKALLVMFPRIWHLEGKVVGADLGMGKFQFDFDDKTDMVEVLKLAPFHFDHWMASMVRWCPNVDSSYPSSLTFWVRVMGVPFQFWAAPTFKSIGEALGTVLDVDIDGGRVQVTVNGLKCLSFETEVEFFNGEETTVSLRYERLFGYCRKCFSMCHDEDHCPLLEEPTQEPTVLPRDDADRRYQSYKGAVKSEGYKGSKADGKRPLEGRVDKGSKGKPVFPVGGPVTKQRRYQTYDHRHLGEAARRSAVHSETKAEVTVPVGEDIAGDSRPAKVVRKALFQDEDPKVAVVAAETDASGALVNVGESQHEVPAPSVSVGDLVVPLGQETVVDRSQECCLGCG
ncbi:PREDICTED: uncharacterized protein LOC104770620 [Camelina sativa]|uniref:Uncharacterized protein LOC104770620 n=1 Tax=Camelina sativa TaxID=90675 RepID=A0ABM0XZV8_CAMSA|nr:PREDICTED: uncharacterized protein LOC104770620 [Camelina sativa]